MITLNVPEMHCNKCVDRIGKALEEAKLSYSISLEEKTVSIEGCENCVNTAISIMDDLGFSATIKN